MKSVPICKIRIANLHWVIGRINWANISQFFLWQTLKNCYSVTLTPFPPQIWYIHTRQFLYPPVPVYTLQTTLPPAGGLHALQGLPAKTKPQINSFYTIYSINIYWAPVQCQKLCYELTLQHKTKEIRYLLLWSLRYSDFYFYFYFLIISP